MIQLNPPIRLSMILVALLATTGWNGVAQIDGAVAGIIQSEQGKNIDPTRVITDTPDNDPYAINRRPRVAQGTGIDSMIGEMLVMDIPFRDEQNRAVELGDYFDGKQPVILSFNYSNCPKLCSVQLENMTLTLLEVAKRFKVKEDFQIISISIDPTEQSSLSRKTKEKYTKIYHQAGTEDGWHFLTGKQKNIELITDICGFRYKYVPEQKLYSHPPVFILISPKGKIVRYIHGLKYDADTIEKALVESAEGKIGSPINILSYGLGCFVFNEATGKYTFQAMAVMRAGAALTALLLLVTLIPYWFFRRGMTAKNDKDSTGLPVAHDSI